MRSSYGLKPAILLGVLSSHAPASWKLMSSLVIAEPDIKMNVMTLSGHLTGLLIILSSLLEWAEAHRLT